jgi:nucleoside-diphosphate-sugar epimerase
MKIMMTGGYGCIGAWIAKHVIDQGGEIWIYDIAEDWHRIDLLIDEEAKTRIHPIQGDVSDHVKFLSAIDQIGATHILHLAGLQTPACRSNPIRGAMVNVIGTLSVFEAAAARKDLVKRVVYASSAAVHGLPPSGDLGERLADDVRLLPQTHYGAYKVCNELNARVYWSDSGVSSVGLRPWTVYGVGRDFGMTSEPTKAIKSAAIGLEYAITYGGLQDFQYVSDVAGTFLAALTRPFEGADVFNLSGLVTEISDFVNALEVAIPESKGLITHGSRQLPIAPNLDASRLNSTFGPLPQTSLVEGIRWTATRFRELQQLGKLDLSDLSV